MHSTTSHSISVRFTLIHIYQTHKPCHMFIKIIYMTFPLLLVLMKMTPIYVFPVFTKHATQMFRSGVHKHLTPGRPGDKISYQDV